MEHGINPLADFMATSATAGSGFGGGLTSLLPFVAIIAIMYFLMIRPQQKKEKQRQEMVAALKRGDRVLTTGGLIGTIHKVIGDGELLVEVAEGTRVRLLAGAVSQLVDKTSTTSPAGDGESEEKGDQKQAKPSAKKLTSVKDAPKSTARKTSATRKTTATRRKKEGSE